MKRTEVLSAKKAYEQSMVALNAVMNAPWAPTEPGKDGICALNASMLVQGSFSQPLTTYATGWRDDGGVLMSEASFLAPEVQTARRFEYAQNLNWEAFLSDTGEDLRSSGGSFKEVKHNTTKAKDNTENRGLQITVDLDDVREEQDWEQTRVDLLMNRLHRNRLRRALAMLTAIDTNTAKTWDSTDGKDPDTDVLSDLVTAADAIGFRPNRVFYGDTAWSKRVLSISAQKHAGGMSRAGFSPEQLAGFLGVQKVMKSDSRYSTTKTAKAQIIGAMVLMFMGVDGAGKENPSNVVNFWSPTDQGTRFAVHSMPLGIKRHIIAVECYEKLVATSTLGVRSFTIS